jgi:hypothetical protein
VIDLEEAELRRLAEELRASLDTVVPDPVERAAIDAGIASALAIPAGQAKDALEAALSSHPLVRRWMRDRIKPRGTGYRLGRPPATRALAETEPPSRRLAVEFPERASVGQRVSLFARITLNQPAKERWAALKPLDVPPEGRMVTITVSAPGLEPRGDLEQDVRVPAADDSEPVRFSFKTGPEGLYPVWVQAYAGGTFLGQLATQILVEADAFAAESPTKEGPLEFADEPGTVTMQVIRDHGNKYRFQLYSDSIRYPMQSSERLAQVPTKVIDDIADELRNMAREKSEYAKPAQVRRRLKNLGTRLWADAVPEAIQRQFWAEADRIRSFIIVSDNDVIPWELLYPLDKRSDKGFLVQQFPVVRCVFDQRLAQWLPLASAAYVVPPGRPSDAEAEVEAVHARLGDGVAHGGVLLKQADLLDLLENAPPSVLHFACHNKFTRERGSEIVTVQSPVAALRPG